MAKKKTETSVEVKRDNIKTAVEHMVTAVGALNVEDGQHADTCKYIAAELERRILALEKLQ